MVHKMLSHVSRAQIVRAKVWVLVVTLFLALLLGVVLLKMLQVTT